MGKYSLEKRSNEKIIKMYFLRKLLFHSSSVTSQEFQVNKLEHEISLSLEKPFLVILLILDKHKEFEEKNDVMTKELLKFAITNITSEILSNCFQFETVEMKNEEIAVIINSEKDQSEIYGQLALLLKEAQEKVLEYYSISFTAILTEKTDNVNELTLLYNRAVSDSCISIRFWNRFCYTAGDVEEKSFCNAA